MTIRGELEDIVKALDVDCFGVAPVSRWNEAPQGFKPTDILPSGRSVVVVGLGILGGVGIANDVAFRGFRPAIYPYMLYGYVMLNYFLAQASYRIAKHLEKKGYISTPIPPSPPNDSLGNRGALSNRHAAVAAGLGTFGWNSLLVTATFGSRIRVSSVITEAEIDCDELYNGPILCDVLNCDYKCAKSCEWGAINLEKSVELRIENQVYRYAVVDKWRCRAASLGMGKSAFSRKQIELPDVITPDNYLEFRKEEDPWQAIEQASIGRSSMCGRCIIDCPVGRK